MYNKIDFIFNVYKLNKQLCTVYLEQVPYLIMI